MRKALLIRSAQISIFNKVSQWVRMSREYSCVHLLTQENTSALINPKLFEKLFKMPSGPIDAISLDASLRSEISEQDYDEFIFPSNQDCFSGNENLFLFSRDMRATSVQFVNKKGKSICYTKEQVISVCEEIEFFYKQRELFNNRLSSFETHLKINVLPNKKYSDLLYFSEWPDCLPKEKKNSGYPLSLTLPDRVRNFFGYEQNAQYFTFEEVSHWGASFSKNVNHIIDLKIANKVTIPFAVKSASSDELYGDLTLECGEKKVVFEQLKCGHWNYVTFEKPKDILLFHSLHSDIVMGEPISHDNPLVEFGKSKPQKKLVLLLVVDALSQSVLSDRTIESLMPHTSKFFRNARHFTNNWCQSYWTLPCIGSLMTGDYPSEHGAYQPTIPVGLKHSSKLLSEYYQNEGYFTFATNTVSRALNPLYGFTRGFDRFIAHNYKKKPKLQKSDEALIGEVIDQLKAFPDRSQFIYLHLLSIHSMEPPYWSLENEVSCPPEERKVKVSKFHFKKNNFVWHEEVVSRYVRLFNDLDQRLKVLFDFLGSSYREEEIDVVLTADHGFEKYTDEPGVLADHRIHVPMIVKSTKLPKGRDDSLVQSTDLFTNLLYLSGIASPEKDSSRLWPVLGGQKRNHILSEAIYGNDFDVCLKNNNEQVHFHTSLPKESIKISDGTFVNATSDQLLNDELSKHLGRVKDLYSDDYKNFLQQKELETVT